MVEHIYANSVEVGIGETEIILDFKLKITRGGSVAKIIIPFDLAAKLHHLLKPDEPAVVVKKKRTRAKKAETILAPSEWN